jgi:hypothetical protein
LLSESKIKPSPEQDSEQELSRHISHIIQLKDSMGYINITLSNSIHALSNCIADIQQLNKTGKLPECAEDIANICNAMSSIKQVLEDAFVKNSQTLVSTPMAKKHKKFIQTEKLTNAFSSIKNSKRDMFFSDEGSNLIDEFSLPNEESKMALL